MYMSGKLILTPTEARKEFFNILKAAENGKSVIIRTKKSFLQFKLEKVNKLTKKEKLKALDRITNLNVDLGGITPEEMNKIISTKFDSYLFPAGK